MGNRNILPCSKCGKTFFEDELASKDVRTLICKNCANLTMEIDFDYNQAELVCCLLGEEIVRLEKTNNELNKEGMRDEEVTLCDINICLRDEFLEVLRNISSKAETNYIKYLRQWKTN